MIGDIQIRSTLDHIEIWPANPVGWLWSRHSWLFKALARPEDAAQPQNQEDSDGRKHQ